MARLEHIRFTPHRALVADGKVHWRPVENGIAIDGLPQIVWNDSTPWREANLWAMERATGGGVDVKTVQSNFTALHAYANWLERTGTDWRSFPQRKADRCLVKYRGALVEDRAAGRLAPSTASQRMTSTVQFYRWLHQEGLISPGSPMWTAKTVALRLVDKIGFERTVLTNSTDLAIPNRGAPPARLEDGLLPVSVEDRDAILSFARDNASEELFLMLSLGFFTGMRLGTLSDLKVQTLDRAVRDPLAQDIYCLAVGPRATPSVATKFNVSGSIAITKEHLEALKIYAYSVRRLMREAKATQENKDLVFLTRFGNPYTRYRTERSTAVNVEMHGLRRAGISAGVAALQSFRFHQSRCTFATEVARLAMRSGGAINAIAIVKDLLLHKNEATSFKYIKFVEKGPVKAEIANAFTRDFLGILRRRTAGHD